MLLKTKGEVWQQRGGTGPYCTILTLDNPLTAGSYRFFICGTTSIWSAAGLELNNGANDTTLDISLASTSSNSSLPETGFVPGQITTLPPHPADVYKETDLVLEIPAIQVKAPIVDVPQG